MRNKWMHLTVLSAAVLLAGSSLVYGKDAATRGKSGDVQLNRETRIGTTTLTPGFYRVQHVMVDGKHFLVVKKRSAEWRFGATYTYGAGQEVARVACDVVAQDSKVRDTAAHIRTAPDGSRSVTQIQVRGERVGHIIPAEPRA